MVKGGIEIAEVDRVNGDELIVSFTDGTMAEYPVEELLRLRPERRLSKDMEEG